MPSHFSTLGLKIETNDDLASFVQRVSSDTRNHAVSGGTYAQWDSGVGAELWFQISRNNQLIGLNPHFGGTARMKVRITAPVSREKHTPLDGAWHAWADPGGENDKDGFYPFVFDTPDFQLAPVSPPTIVDIQLAAFAHELTIFQSEEAYMQSGEKDKPKMAAESFIPSGLFKPGEGKTDPPDAHAIFNGRILDCGQRVNPLTSMPFYWALVKTLGGQIDVVADPELVKHPMVKGGILSGSFWLSGRVVTKVKEGFMQKLFRR